MRQLLRTKKCMDYYQFFCANFSYLEYIEYMFEILTYGVCFPLNFCHWTQICCQNCKLFSYMKFKNHLGAISDKLLGISKSWMYLDLSILITKLCSAMKIEWEIYSICQYFENVLKITQKDDFTQKIDYNQRTFLVSEALL